MSIEQRRNGTFGGIPEGTKIVLDKNGKGRLKKINKSKDKQIKSKDKQKTKGSATLLNLGTLKAAGNKPSSEDEDLGQALDKMFAGTDMNPEQKGNVTPLQSLIGGDNDPNNEVDYGGSDNYDEDDDILAAFEGASNH